MIDEMACLKMEETHLITYRNSLTNRDFRQKLKILQIYIDRDLAWTDAKLLACQEKKAKLQKTMEDYINKSFDVRYIEQCIEYGCGGGMGWDQIIKDAYREKEEEQKRELLREQEQAQKEDAEAEALNFENQTGIFDFQSSNGPEDGYAGCLPSTDVFDPY